jgi:hypothetical protein
MLAMELLLIVSGWCLILIFPMAIVGLIWIKVLGDDEAYLEEHPEAIRDSDGQRTFGSRPISQQSYLIITAIVGVLAVINPVYDKFFAPLTPEQIAAQEQRKLEAKRQAEKERAEEEVRRKEEAAREKQVFVSSLGKNVTGIVDVDFKKLALQHARETELQNDATEKKLKNSYVRIRGEVTEVDSDGDIEHGFKEYMIQLAEGQLFDVLYATARCYATSERDQRKIEGLSIGDKLTIVGKVWSYGDVMGLQMRYCTVE